MSESKWYTNRSNCVRAAKVALGKSAKPDTEFTLRQENGSPEGRWAWTPTARSGLPQAEPTKTDVDAKPVKAKRKRAVKGEKSSVLDQPKMASVLGLMQRKTGVTVEDGMERIGCNRDTFRGMVSRCKTAGAPVTTSRSGRFVSYSVDSEWSR